MSYKIRLSTEEAYILADKMQEIQNKKLSRRLLAISLRHYGYKVRLRFYIFTIFTYTPR